MGKVHAPPPGLDYAPVSGEVENVSFGVAQATDAAGDTMTAEEFIGKRLFPVNRPEDLTQAWPKPTCEKSDVILPRGAADHLWHPQDLARAYDRHTFNVIRDIAVILTLRFPEIEEVPQTSKLHEAWELARNFAYERLAMERSLAVVAVMHVPSRNARPGFPHVHLIAPARVLLPSGFGKFARSIAVPEGRAVLEQEWASLFAKHGRGAAHA